MWWAGATGRDDGAMDRSSVRPGDEAAMSVMDHQVAGDAAPAHEGRRAELVKEAATMALYVAICLLAALAVASHGELEDRSTLLKLIWGTTLGLALAHWFAFRLSSRLVAAGEIRRSDAALALAQLAGSGVVAVLATVPVLVFDVDVELDVTRWVLAGFVAVVGYYVARSSGASMSRSALYGVAVTVVALAVVIAKNALSGH